MSDKFISTILPRTKDSKQGKFTENLKNNFGEPGKISATIGTGDNAKISLIYLTIKWAFISGCVLTILISINYWCFEENFKVPNIIEDLSRIWQIIIPLITLSLGYAFGKSQK